MKKFLFALMFVLCGIMMACVEDGDLPADDDDSPDAGPPIEEEPDACPVTPPDAAPVPPDACSTPAPTLTFTADPAVITVGESSTLSWTSTNVANLGCILTGEPWEQNGAGTKLVSPTTTTTYELFCHGLCGGILKSVTVTVNPYPLCEITSDCNDCLDWTGDACSSGSCIHWVTDCGGMQVRPASNAATCQFWGGFGVPEPAPLLATTSPSSLPTGPSGGDWKAAPPHACSVICYNPGLDETTTDIQIEWNGLTFLHQQLNGLHKGTWDGQNTR